VLQGTPPKSIEPGEDAAQVEADVSPAKGRGLTSRKAGKRIKGRTIYLHDDLFERVWVAAHRRDKNISDYVSWLLDRHVPDHRHQVEPAKESDVSSLA
jgi:hypothetical protein